MIGIAGMDLSEFIRLVGRENATSLKIRKKQAIITQGEPLDSLYCIEKGRVKLTVVSRRGKEAVLAIQSQGEFFGEACLTGQEICLSTATALEPCSILRIAQPVMLRKLHQVPALGELFTTYLLNRNMRIQEDLVDQLFNSAEKRLARVLLLLARFGKEGAPEPVVAKISQETLAEMIGTTRSRVSFFMNKFRKLGFIDYNGTLRVHNALLNIVLHD